MKKIDFVQTVSILANIGIIASIIFLALEVRQNNDQLDAQARYRIYELRDGLERDFINNEGGLAEVVVRASRGEMTELDEARLASRRFRTVRTYAYMFEESPEYAMREAGYMAAIIAGNPQLISTWESMSAAGLFTAGFDNFMTGTVLPRVRQISE